MSAKLYFKFCAGMGVYGFSRTWRSDSDSDSDSLNVEKFVSSVVNGIAYASPGPYQLYALYCLSKRIGYMSNASKETYIDAFKEIGGYCYSTF